MAAICMVCLRDWTADHTCEPVKVPSNLELVVRHLVRAQIIRLRARARQADGAR
jgi:hypothetical protein